MEHSFKLLELNSFDQVLIHSVCYNLVLASIRSDDTRIADVFHQESHSEIAIRTREDVEEISGDLVFVD